MEDSVKWAFEDEMTFSDIVHINSHFNYLFRTDKMQKWTNERTQKNVAVHYRNGAKTVEKFDADLKKRKDVELESLRRFKLLNDTKRISTKLRMLSVVCMEDGAREFTKEMYASLDSLLKRIAKIKGVELFLCVTHVDQDRAAHFHLVLKNSSGKDIIEHLEGGGQ